MQHHESWVTYMLVFALQNNSCRVRAEGAFSGSEARSNVDQCEMGGCEPCYGDDNRHEGSRRSVARRTDPLTATVSAELVRWRVERREQDGGAIE